MEKFVMFLKLRQKSKKLHFSQSFKLKLRSRTAINLQPLFASKYRKSKMKRKYRMNISKRKKLKDEAQQEDKREKYQWKYKRIKKRATCWSLAKLKKLEKRKTYYFNKLLQRKACQICGEVKHGKKQKIIFCQVCDDSFHSDCLGIRSLLSTKLQKNTWTCLECQRSKKLNNQKAIKQKEQHDPLPEEEFPNNYQLYCQTMKILRQENQASNIGQGNLNFKLKPYKQYKLKSKYWIPLIKALNSTKHLYCSQQVYTRKQILKLNQSQLHIPEKMFNAPQKRRIAFEQFRNIVEEGAAPPLTVQKCRFRGYMIRTLDDIKMKTILCEYSGQVIICRESLKIKHNDSIYKLVQSGNSHTSLDIIPTKQGNISKYFLGINNKRIQDYLKINVQSLLFCYKGRNRIIFYTTRDIKKEEYLYLNYNGGITSDYPTSKFK